MNPDTGQIMQLDSNTAIPPGFVELPTSLQPSAKKLIAWATSTKKARASKKRERQNRRAGRH
jgi:hypothetical protein